MKLSPAAEGRPELKVLPKSAKAAKAIGSKLYYNGNRCLLGHRAARNTKDHRCTECDRISLEKSKEWLRTTPLRYQVPK